MSKPTAHAIPANWKQLTSADFHVLIAGWTLTYTPTGRWSDVWGYWGEWKTPAGRVVAYSDSGGEGIPGAGGERRYWASPLLFGGKEDSK